MAPRPSWLGRTSLADLASVAGAGAVTVLLLFLTWQGIEDSLAPSDHVRHLLHYARGISTSLVTGGVIAFVAFRQGRRRAAALEGEVARRTRDLEEARAILEVIVDATPAGLILLSEDRKVVQANRAAETVHGGNISGRPCHEALLAACGACSSCPLLPAAEKLAPVRRLQVTDSRTGEVVEIESHPVRLASGEAYTLFVERILTEQKKLQARIVHQEKMAAFGLLAAGVAHDLGNPLASVTVQLQLLDDLELPPEAAEVVQTVRGEVARLHRMLRELVDFARRRRDEAAFVSVQEAVDDALTLLRHDPRMRKIETRVEADPETPPVFMVEDHLVQVVLNLMINAVDAMPEGGTLHVEIGRGEGEVALRVNDTGVGMDRAVLARAFEPLYTTKPPGKGTGLGLSVCRDIVETAGGRIELHSTRGRGTTVVVTLPHAEAGAERPPAASNGAEAA